MSEVFYPIKVLLTCNECGGELYWVGNSSKSGINLSVAPCKCAVKPDDEWTMQLPSEELWEEGEGE